MGALAPSTTSDSVDGANGWVYRSPMVREGGNAGPFIGRADEVGVIRASVAAASASAGPHAVFLHGPPGIGKTRLLHEAERDWNDGAVVRLTGYVSESAVALGSAAVLLREVSSEGAHRELLQVFEGADRWMAQRGPTVVVVDDLQWIDEASRALLHYLARGAVGRRAPLSLVVATREDPGCRAYVAELRSTLGQAACTELELEPLTEQETNELAAALSPSVPIDGVHDRTGGWPFWIELFCRGPKDAEEALERWLREADSDAWSVLGVLAVLARPVTPDELAAILRWPRLRVLAAVEAARRRALSVSDGRGERIAHDLLREAVLDRHPPSERVRLHTMVARHLEAVAGEDVHPLLEAMGHRSQAGLPSLALVRRVFDSPGGRSIGAGGVDELWGAVLGTDADTDEITDILGRLAALTAELGEPAVALDRWVTVATRLPEGRTRARAWLEASRAAARAEDPGTAELMLTRSRGVASPDEALCVHWDAQEAALRFLDGELDRGAVLADRALRRARALSAQGPSADRSGHDDARLHALAVATDAARLRGDAAALAEVGMEMTTVAAGRDEHASLTGLRAAGFGLLMLGRVVEAEAHLRVAWERAQALTLPLAMLDGGFWLVLALHWRGQLDAAREVLDELVGVTHRLGKWSRSVENVHVGVHLVELSRGDWQAALEGLRRHADAERDPHARIRVTYWLGSALARLAPDSSAEEVTRRLVGAGEDARAAACSRCAGELALRAADALARCGEPDHAAKWMDRFDPTLMPADRYLAWWSTRAQATIALATDATDALERLAATVTRADELNLALESVWARIDLAHTDADGATAVAHLQEAHDRARAMNAATEARLAAQGLRAAGVRAWRRSAAAQGDGPLGELTPREREIARLVAAGSSNREVAERLFVSPKTVESHLSHVFTKLDVRNRVELAALLHEARAEP